MVVKDRSHVKTMRTYVHCNCRMAYKDEVIQVFSVSVHLLTTEQWFIIISTDSVLQLSVNSFWLPQILRTSCACQNRYTVCYISIAPHITLTYPHAIITNIWTYVHIHTWKKKKKTWCKRYAFSRHFYPRSSGGGWQLIPF